MVNKVIPVITDIFFPKSHLQIYLSEYSQLQLESRLISRIQKHGRMFYPFYYKDPFIRDCVIELKERGSQDVAKLFGKVLGQWIVMQMSFCMKSAAGQRRCEILLNNHKIPYHDMGFCDRSLQNNNIFYLVPVPQHISKTREKGFCHTTLLTTSIYKRIQSIYPNLSIQIFPCISKIHKTIKLHDSKGKRARFKTIKNTMCANITKYDAKHAYFFIIDDVFTTGATFKEMRRSLLDSGASSEQIFFISIAH